MTVERISHWIGGKLVPGESGRTGPVFNPATGEQTHEVDFASREEVDAGGRAAAPRPSRPGAPRRLSKRADIMFRIRELMDDATRRHREARSRRSTARCSRDAMGEVAARPGERRVRRAASRSLLKGGFTEQASTGVDVYSIRQPLGVVAGITPFNFPAMVPLWMFAERDRVREHLHPEALREGPRRIPPARRALHDAGVPDGVFNVVHGDKVAVDALLEHPDVKAVSLRRLDADREVHLRARHDERASASRRSAARRTTWSCCPTPTSTWRPTPP